jgi:hypothetical protein
MILNYKIPTVNKFIKTSIIALSLVVFSSFVSAQSASWSGPLSFGISSGANVYKGDMTDVNKNPWLSFSKDSKLGVSGFFDKELGPFNLRFQMDIGGLKGYNFRADERFSNNFYEYSGRVALNVNRMFHMNDYQDDGYNFYVLAGYGLIRYSSYLTDMSQFSMLQEVGYAKIGKGSVIIGGAGVKINLMDKLNFLGEVSYHMANVDDLDAKIGVNDSNDSFYFISLGLSYDILGKSSGGGSHYRKSLRWGHF